MKQINRTILEAWVFKVGRDEAIIQIARATGLSFSSIEKIIRDQYPAKISFLAKKAISEITGIHQDKLFKKII